MEFKFEIVKRRPVEIYEKFPPHFLGDTILEAEKLYKTFSQLLNKISYGYAVTTGLSKTDIFGEALIGLARARRDFDPDKGNNFKGYVVFRVKDAINIYIRKNRSVISTPAYIKNANRHLNKMKEGCPKSAELFEKIAIRAKISTKTLIKRAESIPSDVEYEERYTDDREKEMMWAALVVEKLKKCMKGDELKIAKLIMEGKTYREIGKEFDKTAPWVVYKLEKLRGRLMKGGEEFWER